jgi:hypothetical protein
VLSQSGANSCQARLFDVDARDRLRDIRMVAVRHAIDCIVFEFVGTGPALRQYGADQQQEY